MSALSTETCPSWATEALESTPETVEVSIEGYRICGYAWGDRAHATVVLVHGGAAHAHWWTFVGPHLAKDFRVVAVDLSGHGRSDWRPSYGFETWAQEIWAIADHLGGSDEWVLMGHSMGGRAALVAAHRVRSPDGLAMIDTPLQYMDPGIRSAAPEATFAPRFYESREAALARFRLRPRQPEPPHYVVDHIAAMSVMQDSRGWRWRFDPAVHAERDDPFVRQDLSDLVGSSSCPVAFLVGEYSTRVRDDVLAGLGGSLSHVRPGGYPVSHLEVPGAHHHVPLDRPLELVAALRVLLQAWLPATPVSTGRPG